MKLCVTFWEGQDTSIKGMDQRSAKCIIRRISAYIDVTNAIQEYASPSGKAAVKSHRHWRFVSNEAIYDNDFSAVLGGVVGGGACYHCGRPPLPDYHSVGLWHGRGSPHQGMSLLGLHTRLLLVGFEDRLSPTPNVAVDPQRLRTTTSARFPAARYGPIIHEPRGC